MPAPELALRGGLPAPDWGELEAVAHDLGTHPVAVDLLRRRGLGDPTQLPRALEPRLKDLRRPVEMAGFSEALELLDRARRDGSRVGIFGDYDVDGVTTTAILASFLEDVGLEVVSRVARRDTGYGFSVGDAQALQQAGAQVVLTGDCGTSDHEALGHLQKAQIPTVVIDHHQVPESMPPAHALINPHQSGCRFPFKGLCSAGVAFYLCAALRTKVVAGGGQAPDPRRLLDLVALATVCDMVPLREENRVLARHGLARLGQRQRPGLRALLRVAGVDALATVTEDTVGFKLGPRLNAPGRLGPADPALQLLRARTDLEARAMADQVDALNVRRQDHTKKVVAEALALCAADPKLEQRAGLVVAREGWLPGVVGIAANGVVEHHGRPALVIAIDKESGEARGSVRSTGGVDVRAALAACRDLLDRFGGHREAAGVSLRAERVEALVEAFDEAVRRQVGRLGPQTVRVHDGGLRLDQVTSRFVSAVVRLGPYGVGFERPVFVVDDVEVIEARVLKEKHLRLVVEQGKARQECIAFGWAHLGVERGDRVGGLVTPGFNDYRGQRRVQLAVGELWRA